MKAPPTYADYLAMKEEYAAGRASLDKLTALVTPEVAQQVSDAETRKPPVPAAQLSSRDKGQLLLGVFLLLAFTWTLALGLGHAAGPAHARPAPAMSARWTGPGDLILDGPQGRVMVRVQTVIEETDGIVTRLPVWYVDAAGHERAWDGAFTFTPATAP